MADGSVCSILKWSGNCNVQWRFLEHGRAVSPAGDCKEARFDIASVSLDTIWRTLHRMGYSFLQCRRKGVLTEKDLIKRKRFARMVKNEHPEDLWKEDICFYIDSVSFVQKFHPNDQARAPRGRTWRKKSEGLSRDCTAEGSHVGSGGRLLKLFVAISFSQGFICAHQYDKVTGDTFEQFILQQIPIIYKNSRKMHSNLFVEDGDPSQNSAKSLRAVQAVGMKLFKIPPRIL